MHYIQVNHTNSQVIYSNKTDALLNMTHIHIVYTSPTHIDC